MNTSGNNFHICLERWTNGEKEFLFFLSVKKIKKQEKIRNLQAKVHCNTWFVTYKELLFDKDIIGTIVF
jgi:hypothetical protein